MKVSWNECLPEARLRVKFPSPINKDCGKDKCKPGSSSRLPRSSHGLLLGSFEVLIRSFTLASHPRPSHVPTRRLLVSNIMKQLRTLSTSLLLVTITGVLPGCATTPSDSATVATGIKGIEKKQPSPTADMTGFEKTGYYLGWLSLDVLYGWAGGNQTVSPLP